MAVSIVVRRRPLTALLSLLTLPRLAGDWTASLGTEMRIFLQEAAFPGRGYPANLSLVFDALREALDISQGRLAELAAIPISTLKRREADGRFNLQESDRLLRLATIYTRTLELFEEDQPQGRQWLKNPVRALGGVSPLEHAQTEIGAREVLDLIGRLEYGVLS